MSRAAVGRTLAVLCVVAVASAGCGGHTGSPSTTSSGTPHAAPTSQQLASTGSGLFDVAEPFGDDVSAAAVSSRSAAIIEALNGLGGWGNGNTLQVDFSIPILVADGSTPRMQIVGAEDYCFGGPDCDSVPAEMPIPADANFEGSSDLTCDPSGNTDGQGDCHLLVADRDAHKLFEVYQGSRAGDAIAAGGFFVWDLTKSYPDTLRGDQCTSADAAGFPIAAMLPTADEVASGTVDHPLRFILPNDRMKEGVYVRPATHAGGPESTDPNAPPYGVRFRLKPDFDQSGYSPAEQTILTALKTYGMLLSDGGEIALTFADDRTSSAKWSDLGIESDSFGDLGVDEFDVVDLGPEVAVTYDCVRNP